MGLPEEVSTAAKSVGLGLRRRSGLGFLGAPGWWLSLLSG